MDNKWSFKDVIVGKTLWVILLTVALELGVIKVVCRVFSVLYFALTPYEGNYVFRPGDFIWPIHVALLIAAYGISFVLAVPLVRLFLNLRGTPSSTNRSRQIAYSHDKEFKWHLLYGLAIGYAIWMGLLLLFSKLFFLVQGKYDNSFVTFAACLCVLILPVLIASKLTKLINKLMTRKTGTNEELIEALESWELCDELPARLQTQEAIDGMVNILRSSAATTLSGAILIYRYLEYQKKLVQHSLAAAKVVAIIVGVLSLGLLLTPSSSSFSSDIADIFTGPNFPDTGVSRPPKDLTSQLWFQKQQAEKRRDTAVHYAAKQAGVNVRSFEMTKRWNAAKNAQRDVDEITKLYNYSKYK